MFRTPENFSDLEKENQKETKSFEERISDNNLLLEIKEIYKNEVKEVGRIEEKLLRFLELDEIYNKFYNRLPEVSPSLLENYINNFIELIKKEEIYRPDCFGLLVSALINKTVEKNQKENSENLSPLVIHLNVKSLPQPPSFLGFRNLDKCHLIIEGNCGNDTGALMEGGQIEIRGDCGSYTGFYMEGGKIKIEGNCGDDTGFCMRGSEIEIKGSCGKKTGCKMKRGLIMVEGNCGDGTGWHMQGGIIEIKGNCGEELAFDMEGGKIIVHGNIKSFAFAGLPLFVGKFYKGEIWHQGKRIWPKEAK